jgi:hypothetical protein
LSRSTPSSKRLTHSASGLLAGPQVDSLVLKDHTIAVLEQESPLEELSWMLTTKLVSMQESTFQEPMER